MAAPAAAGAEPGQRLPAPCARRAPGGGGGSCIARGRGRGMAGGIGKTAGRGPNARVHPLLWAAAPGGPGIERCDRALRVGGGAGAAAPGLGRAAPPPLWPAGRGLGGEKQGAGMIWRGIVIVVVIQNQSKAELVAWSDPAPIHPSIQPTPSIRRSGRPRPASGTAPRTAPPCSSSAGPRRSCGRRPSSRSVRP